MKFAGRTGRCPLFYVCSTSESGFRQIGWSACPGHNRNGYRSQLVVARAPALGCGVADKPIHSRQARQPVRKLESAAQRRVSLPSMKLILAAAVAALLFAGLFLVPLSGRTLWQRAQARGLPQSAAHAMSHEAHAAVRWAEEEQRTQSGERRGQRQFGTRAAHKPGDKEGRAGGSRSGARAAST